MLHTSAVEPVTLSILRRLMMMSALNQFSLVGGTALALKYEHRVSIDLDLFSNAKIDQDGIEKALEAEFSDAFVFEKTKVTFAVFCRIKNIKVDIVHYPHPLVAPAETIQGVRMYSDSDLAAMKINAILGRGEQKDFYDIAQLLNHYSLADVIKWHKTKYPSQMLAISIPDALSYFVDADNSTQPKVLNGQSWESVKKQIQKAVREYLA